MSEGRKLSSADKKNYKALDPKRKINPINVFIYIFDLLLTKFPTDYGN